MIVLTETTDNLQVVLGGAITTNQLSCMANYRDITTTAYTPGRNVTNTNNTTDVNLVPAPSASTQRVVDFLSVYNNDTANATVTIKFDANGTEYILFKTTLSVGEKIEYCEGKGFRVFTNAGSEKMSVNQGNNTVSSSFTTVVLGSDVVNNNAIANTIADVTGLSFAVTSGKTYYFRFVIPYISQAGATGSRWSINGPTNTFLSYYSNYTATSTSITNNQGLNAFDSPAASNATSLTAADIAIVEGFISPSANGTVIARFASEVAGSAITAKAGAIVMYQEVL